MNEIVFGLPAVLLRTTLFLSGAAIAVRLLLKFGRPTSPMIHRMAWCLVLLVGWFGWRLPVTIPYYQPAVMEKAPTGMRAVPQQLAHVHQIADARSIVPAKSPHAGQPPIDPHRGETIWARWPLVVAAVWFVGIFVLMAASLVSYVRFLRSLRATSPAEETWAVQWEALLKQYGTGEAIPLRVTENIGPVLCRVPREHILAVPVALWQRLAPAERLSILRHELAHLQRHDLLKSLLVRLLALPHWFNPLAWLATGQFDEAAEWACDEVAKGTDSQEHCAYAKALLELDAVFGPRLSYQAAASGRGLSVRVCRLLHPQVKEDSIVKKTFILGTALGLALLCLLRFDLVAKEPAEKGKVEESRQEQAGADLSAQTVGKVGSEVIHVSDIMATLDEIIEGRADEVPPEQMKVQRAKLVKEVMTAIDAALAGELSRTPLEPEQQRRKAMLQQLLKQQVESKLVYTDAKAKMTAAQGVISDEFSRHFEKILTEAFEEGKVKKLMKRYNVDSQDGLDHAPRDHGTSIEREKRAFIERTLSHEWLRQQVMMSEKEVTFDQVVAYYRAHAKDFDRPAKTRWQELSLAFSQYPSKQEARAAIAAMRDQVLAGADFVQAAKAAGMELDDRVRDWPDKTRLVSSDVAKAIEGLPAGKPSAILEDWRGVHIVRVVERIPARRVPLEEAGAEIGVKIKQQRAQTQMQTYLDHLREQIPVWTVLDAPTESAQTQPAGDRR